ncbi:hypothetical protein PIB30_029229 [Stylosanthes scabra]|uniref:F-box domain-containing protein n=1 Tax=Stylosanthes scabra TaxID=79078 RepID=A0ABU6SC02_9FABA|nr:hypothetical protein [Stylosanthes scabra]
MMCCFSLSKSNPKPPEEGEEELIPSLPNELALNCLARVPRWHHRALSQVSKPIRSLLHSPLFYNLHSTIHGKQPFLYLHLHSHYFPSQWWAFSLASPSPSTTILPFPIPLLPSPTYQPAYAILGHHIYVIGCRLSGIISRQVWILDCRFNTGNKALAWSSLAWAHPLLSWTARSMSWADGDTTRDFRKRVDKLWVGRNGWGCFEDGFFYKLNYPAMLTAQEFGEEFGWAVEVEGLLDLPGWSPPDTNGRPKQLAGSIANGSLFVVWIEYWNQEYKLWCSELEVNKSKRGHDDHQHWEVSVTPAWSHKVLFCSEQFKMGGSLVVDGL